MQFPAPAAVSGWTIIVAAYEAMFARIGDLGGGVLSDLIGSPGLPECMFIPTRWSRARLFRLCFSLLWGYLCTKSV